MERLRSAWWGFELVNAKLLDQGRTTLAADEQVAAKEAARAFRQELQEAAR